MKKNLATFISTSISANRRFIPLFTTATFFFVTYAIGAVFFEGMRKPQIFLNLFRTQPFLLIAAVGGTFVILSGGGGIDLSVAGIIALTGTASAALLRSGWNPWLVMLLMLVMGVFIGSIMGSLVTFLKVQPFIATLAFLWIGRGLSFLISDVSIPIYNPTYTLLSQTKILIPGLSDPVSKTGPFILLLVVLVLVVYALAIYILHYTRFDRTVYAIGGNEQSARLMGLRVNATKMGVYALAGFFSALAGITHSIYVGGGHGLYVPGLELMVIASVVMGGTMLTGGVGYILGTCLVLWRNRKTLIPVGVTLCLIVFTISGFSLLFSGTTSTACQDKPFRQEQAASLMKDGAVITYERNGGSTCIDELYAIYPDGTIKGNDDDRNVEKQATPEEVTTLLEGIAGLGWFTEELYSTWHTPCGQCYTYFTSVSYQGQVKTVQAVNGGTDAPDQYWMVVSLINGVIPPIPPTQ
jgi:ribose/xylose/arabinose/galactoside ABC-type transport system permease subunit